MTLPLARLAWVVAVSASLLAPARARAAAAPSEPAESYDLVVYGGTPGGVATAVRAAREGLNVLLVNRSPALGGQLSNGMGVWDTLYDGYRSPIYQEVRQAIFDHYRVGYGPGSPQLRAALPGPKTERFVNGRFEPKVAEKTFDDLVARESKLTVLRRWELVGAERDGARVSAVTIRPVGAAAAAAAKTRRVAAKVFADATYEADLAGLANAPYRIGRESREEFNEPHAGRVFAARIETTDPKTGFPVESADGRLNLRYYHITSGDLIRPESTGAGDEAVMASNFRFVLCNDPSNRIAIQKPKGYDAAKMREQIPGTRIQMPNNKFSWNRPEPLPFKDRWAEADWAERDRMSGELLDLTLQKLWFLQHDESVPDSDRAFWRECGLPKDEFVGNGHIPWEIYLREARRIEGRRMLTQHDFMPAPGLARAPVQADSVAFTDWVIDLHACHAEKVKDSAAEGALILSRETRPGQVPYASMLPVGIDNLLVPVCVSSTHVAWGAIRLEPVWMQTGEAAGVAAAMAVKGETSPAAIDVDDLLRRLCGLPSMLTFLNDADVATQAPWVPAVQFFGTKGFFPTYEAAPDKPLTAGVAQRWAESFGKLAAKEPLDVMAAARAVFDATNDESTGSRRSLTANDFTDLLKAELRRRKLDVTAIDATKNEIGATATAAPLTRGEACRIAFVALGRARKR